MSCKRSCINCAIYLAVLLLLAAILLFIIVPVTFMFSTGVQKSLIFPTYLIEPKDYSDPEIYGLTGAKNLYLNISQPHNGGENVTLGIWQILPREVLNPGILYNKDYDFEGILKEGKHDILIYLHGNGADRSKSVPLYNILREFFHIFAVDYRGYADSTGVDLTETNIVNDIGHTYKWLNNQSGAKIFVWGHSLGTGVATHLLANLKREKITAAGLILEAPFTSVVEVMKGHPIIKFYSFLPWGEATFLNPIKDNDMNFDSKTYIKDVDCPIMILHAKDDEIIPFENAADLYMAALSSRNKTYQGAVTFHLYEPKGNGHMYLYLEPDLPKQVEKFVAECLDFATKEPDL